MRSDTPASSDVVETRGSPAEMAERLRGWADHVNPVHLLREAADMIERLTDGNWGNDARTTQLRYRLANEKDRAESAEAERDAAIEHLRAIMPMVPPTLYEREVAIYGRSADRYAAARTFLNERDSGGGQG